MKVQRYPLGKTNTGLLREMKSNLMSPEYAAYAEAAKYNSMAEAAGAAGQATTDVLMANAAMKKEADATQAALDLDNYQAAYKRMIQEAEEQGWTEEQFRANADALNRTLKDSLKMISEENRPKIQNAYQNIMGQIGLQTDQVAIQLRTKEQVERVNARREEALAEKDYVSLGYLDDLALKNKWIDKAEYQKRQRTYAELQQIDSMLEDYKKLDDEQKIADFMSGITTSGLSDEGQRSLVGEIDFYNKTQKAQQAIFDEQKREQLDRMFVDIGQSIQYATIETPEDLQRYAEIYSDENLHAIADEMDLSRPEREKLFNKRNQRLKEIASRGNKDSGGDIEPDLTSKPYRDSITTDATAALGIIPENASVEDRNAIVAFEVKNAKEYGAIGTTTTNFLNNSATGGARGDEKGWEQFLQALPIYEKLASTDNVVWDGVDPDNRAMYETIRYMNPAENPDLARKVWVNYNSASPQELDRAKAQYDYDQLLVEIMDREDLAGTAGLIRPDFFMWFNEEPEIPGATQAMIRKVGETLAIHEGLTNGVVDYRQLSEKVANVMGTMLTTSTLNEGVPIGAEGMKRIKSEAMLYAPGKKESEAAMREILNQDLLGLDYKTNPDVKGKEVKVFNDIYTIRGPLELGAADAARQDFGDPMQLGFEEGMPEPFGVLDEDEKTIPVNWIRIVTPPLVQDQFNDLGQRIWHLYYRGKPLLNSDNTYMEWTPHFDPDTGVARILEENATQ